MLEIKNIGRIVGLLANGRQIISAGDYKSVMSKDLFYFKIESIGDKKEFNREHSIVLEKYKHRNGMYYMFNMGLESVTGVYLTHATLKNPLRVVESIRKVLEKTQQYYETI